MTEYLTRLNPEQRQAVEALDGPVLVLAGAGTGKTRVLTTRFAHILLTGRAAPGQVLAVTFTNKAAREMRERVGAILGRPAEGLWLGTFHALCARMLRRHADLVGLTSGFTILDSDDQLRLLKQVMEAARIDAKRWLPQVLMGMIQRWKDRGVVPGKVPAAEEGDFAGGLSKTLYAAYQARLAQLNTCDFGDLLLHMVEILRSRPDILAEYGRRFRYILVDEYQDTNVVQYLWLRLLAQAHKNICCVGDDDQCLAAGTQVTMADGSTTPIERIRPGDSVLSCYGSGDFRPARVLATHAGRPRRQLVRLRTASGREILSTPEHVHFADAVPGENNGAARLVQAQGLDPDRPNDVPRSGGEHRRTLTMTLFAERRGAAPMHRIAISGCDEEGRATLASLGLSARPCARNPANWRYESAVRDMGRLADLQDRLRNRLPVTLVRNANLLGAALSLRPAAQVRPGMMVATADGRHDTVVAVEPETADIGVHDIDVEATHNYVANGIVTHNSIYSWRGAEVENILRFEHDFPGAVIVRLERNYRSTAPILAAAAGLIANNEGRLGKTLRPGRDDATGDPVSVVSLWDSDEEARMVGERIEALRRDGHPLAEIAILVRTTAQTRAFEERLIVQGTPYRIIGGLRFYERAEIRDAVAYMRVLHQPADDLAFERIVNIPRRGVGEGALRTMHDAAREQRIPLAEAAHGLVRAGALKGKLRDGLAKLFSDLASWRDALPRDGHVLVLATMLDDSGYMAMWQADKSPDAPGRIENLKELIRALADFESLAGFLDHVSLVMENEENAEGDRCSMMTLHGAKGLEFDTVFLPGWEEGLFPSQRTLDEGGQKGLEEERRLAYVGLTRARRRAIVSHAANRRLYANWQSSIPSRFVDELPEAHVEKAGSAALQREQRLLAAPSLFGNGPLIARRAATPKIIEPWEQPPRPARAEAIPVGSRVFHQKFGYGHVLAVDDDRLDVMFEKAGQKRLLDRFVEKA